MLSGEDIFCLCFFLAFLKRFQCTLWRTVAQWKIPSLLTLFLSSSSLKKDSLAKAGSVVAVTAWVRRTGGLVVMAACWVLCPPLWVSCALLSPLLPSSWHSPSHAGKPPAWKLCSCYQVGCGFVGVFLGFAACFWGEGGKIKINGGFLFFF